ncbi:MAG: hypothetical protein R6U26_03605 [Candidatus Undinarchaeales archaeon]
MDLKTARKSGLFPKLIQELPRIRKVVSIVKNELGREFAFAVVYGSSVQTPSKDPDDIDLYIGIHKNGIRSQKYFKNLEKVLNSFPDSLNAGVTGYKSKSSENILIEVSLLSRDKEELGLSRSHLDIELSDVFYPFVFIDGDKNEYNERMADFLVEFILSDKIEDQIKEIERHMKRDADPKVLKLHSDWWTKIKKKARKKARKELKQTK